MKTFLTGEWLIRATTARQRRVANYWMTVFWIVMIPISFATGWVHSVVYVSALSLWALVSSHFGAWAAETPVEAEEEIMEQL